MKKILPCLLLIFLIFPTIFAIEVEIQKNSQNEVFIKNLGDPIIFDLDITNNGSTGIFEIYNLLGFAMTPNLIEIEKDETKNIKLEVIPSSDFGHPGNYFFDYFIRAKDNSEVKEELSFKIIELKDVFEVGSGEVNSQGNSLKIFIKNKENFDFGEINVKFSSVFFDFEETFNISAYETKEFDVELNKDDFNRLGAGFYTLEAQISVRNQEAEVEGIIKFPEQNSLKTTKEDYGFIISTQVIEKINEGNTIISEETIIKKNIISRLFTSFSPQPDIIERNGLTIFYIWNNEINPGESLKITIKTNWLFPFLIILFIVVIVVLTKQYIKTNLVLKKKVSFVKAKGGEFALKITILVNAKKYVENVRIVDRLPPLVKIYERFGTEKPSRIDEANKLLGWDFEKLEAGEIRVLSYIIYSKVGVIGKFALPSATAIYDREGNIKESKSNKAFFVTEQRGE